MINTHAEESMPLDESFMNLDIDKQEGIKAFQQKEYTKSIYYLENYFRRQPQDEIAADYLYGAYIQTNRINQAKSIFPYLSEENKAVYIVRPKVLGLIYAEGGLLGKGNIKEEQKKDNSLFFFPEYKTGGYGLILFDHSLTPSLTYKHSLSFYAINGTQKIYQNKSIANYSIDERQFSYSGNFQYCYTTGWEFGINGAYFNDQYHTIEVRDAESVKKGYRDLWHNYYEDKIPDYREQYINSSTTDTGIRNQTVTDHTFAVELKAKKSFDWFYPELQCSYANVSKTNVWQPKFKFTLFPLRNLNIYCTTTLADIIYNHTGNFIFEELIGGKIKDWFWVEATYANGNMKFYNENDFITFYTMLTKSKHRASFKTYFPLTNNLSLSLLYRLMTKESTYRISGKKGEETIYKQKSNSHNIIGGIKCTF